MRAPNDKPTEKTERRLASQSLSNNPNKDVPQYIEVDLKTLVQELIGEDSANAPEDILTTNAIKRIDTKEAITTVKAILGEYFDCYMLMGYGVDGKRTIIRQAKTDQHVDSILEMFRYVFMRLVQGS